MRLETRARARRAHETARHQSCYNGISDMPTVMSTSGCAPVHGRHFSAPSALCGMAALHYFIPRPVEKLYLGSALCREGSHQCQHMGYNFARRRPQAWLAHEARACHRRNMAAFACALTYPSSSFIGAFSITARGHNISLFLFAIYHPSYRRLAIIVRPALGGLALSASLAPLSAARRAS